MRCVYELSSSSCTGFSLSLFFYGWNILDIYCWAVLLYLYLLLFVCWLSYAFGWCVFLCRIRLCHTPRFNLFKVSIIIIIITSETVNNTSISSNRNKYTKKSKGIVWKRSTFENDSTVDVKGDMIIYYISRSFMSF
jgi:hypothetical protein